MYEKPAMWKSETRVTIRERSHVHAVLCAKTRRALAAVDGHSSGGDMAEGGDVGVGWILKRDKPHLFSPPPPPLQTIHLFSNPSPHNLIS